MTRGVMKTCRICREVKPLDEFYANLNMASGRLNECKSCKKAYVNNRRAVHGEHVRMLDRLAHLRNREADLQRNREYAAGHLDTMREQKCQWRRRNAEKVRAMGAVRNAVRDGRLHKEPCRYCGDTEVEAHHPDYSKPLEVVWVCGKHHKMIHRHERMLVAD